MGIENTTVKGLNGPSLTGFGALILKQFRNNNGLFVVTNRQVIYVHGHVHRTLILSSIWKKNTNKRKFCSWNQKHPDAAGTLFTGLCRSLDSKSECETRSLNDRKLQKKNFRFLDNRIINQKICHNREIFGLQHFEPK